MARGASTTSGSARKRHPQPRAHRQLEIPGLVPERHTLDGEPKHTLLEWAERWNADCIFIGTSGRQHPDTETLGPGRARPLLGGNRAAMLRFVSATPLLEEQHNPANP